MARSYRHRNEKDEVKVYEGFDRNSIPMSKVEHVVLVQNEDSIEVFILDDPKVVRGLVEYLDDHYPDCHIIGQFSRTK